MSRQGGFGSFAFGILFLVAFAGWVLSQIWLYMVIGAAAVLVGWLAVIVTRTIQASPPRPRLVPATAPRLAPAPADRYGELLQIDPSVFDDPVLAEGVALNVFRAWTRQLAMPPSDPTGLVRSLNLRVHHAGRLASEIVERQIVWREGPCHQSSPATSPPISIDRVEPWSTTPDELRNTSRHVAKCAPCDGRGTVACPTCDGKGQVPCSNCHGAGKAYGYAKNGSRRLLKCRTCEGKLTLTCSDCTSGKVECSNCQGSGRHERWLEIVEKIRHDVHVRPEGHVLRAFAWGTGAEQASQATIAADVRIVGEASAEGSLSKAQISQSAPPAWLDEHWTGVQPTLHQGERVRRQTFWLLEIPSIELSYAFPGGEPTEISFEGLRMLAPPATLDRSFAARARKIRLARYVLIGLSAGTPIAYLLRGRYYASVWVAGLALCAAGIAFAVDHFMQDWTLGRLRSRTWAVLAAIGAVFACGLAVGAEPSLRAARRLLSTGQIEGARTELVALGHAEEPTHVQAWADLHLTAALRSGEPDAIRAEVEQISPTLPQRATAARHLGEVVGRVAQQHLSRGEIGAAEAVLTKAIPTLRQSPDSGPLLAQIDELRGTAQDQAFGKCLTDACRFAAALRATAAAPNPARRQHLDDARASVIGDLTFQPRPKDSTLERLQRLRAIAATTGELGNNPGDAEVAAKALAADEVVRQERAKIPWIGADPAVLGELLGMTFDASASTLSATVSTVAVHFVMQAGRCAGVYLVGSEKGARVLNDSTRSGPTNRLLSQALGREVKLPEPPTARGGQTPRSSTWKVGSVPITGRWNGTNLVELRVGRAQP